MSQVRTRIASSQDGGASWVDVGVDPNQSNLLPDFQVTVGAEAVWVTWRFEVSRLFYDPYDTDANQRWKILWHRVAAIGSPDPAALYQNSWIGYSSAATPDGSWHAERKLFTGSLYNSADMDPVIGPPEFPLNTDYSTDLGGCTLFTEPGVLARSDGICISLQCTGERKIVLLRCDRVFSTCDYLGDLLTAADASQFSLNGESLDFIGASELVDTETATYLIVTGVDQVIPGADQPTNRYSGCLVFRVSDLDSARVERIAGNPVLIKRVDGSSGSFNGACGYDAQADGSGIIYSEFTPIATPRFHLFSSHVILP
ncbi:MAG: hypothetical protein KZQ95_10670 [Candidatus Thiodiazotropha sp. (ex Epidulcina cf. delphinae)]|nr:hypothetical protein [Candidatus Thiodiazotropha sp. (ex Epidulcina cf. delphinae)]